VSNVEQEVRVRRLEPQDDRSGFRSGNIDIDRFFQRYASQNQFRHHIGTTYVAVQGGYIVGFVTVSSGEMVAEKLTKTVRRRLPAYPLPNFAPCPPAGRGRAFSRAWHRPVVTVRHL